MQLLRDLGHLCEYVSICMRGTFSIWMTGWCPARYLPQNTINEPSAAVSVRDTFLPIPYFYASCLLALRHLTLEVRGTFGGGSQVVVVVVM